mgnify:CR=1 FL=1
MSALGIDLGTSNSCVYRWPGDVLASPNGGTLTPSAVCVGPDAIVCGATALATGDPQRTFVGFKRTIGRCYKDKQLWRSATEWPFALAPPKDPATEPPLYCATLGGEFQQLTPFDLYVHLLRYMLRDAGSLAHRIVATVPAHFDSKQRKATAEAVRQATGKGCELLNEPTAAAVAYLHDNPDRGHGSRVLVVDVGGGTTDATLLLCDDGDLQVVASEGTSEAGGSVITDCLIRRVGKQRWIEVDEAKRQLSEVHEVELSTGRRITRDEVEETAAPVLEAVARVVTKCVGKHGPPSVVVLCGGTTRMPSLRKRLGAMFPQAELSTDLNPDTAVARGAAIHAASAVARAPKAADILTASVGVRIREDTMLPLVKRGVSLPHSYARAFMPMSKEQSSSELVILQGNSTVASENTELGRYSLLACKFVVSVQVDCGGSIAIEVDRDGETLLKRVVK